MQGRETNIGFHVFVEELKHLFGELQSLGDHFEEISEDYFETSVRRLDEAAGTLQLLVSHLSSVLSNSDDQNDFRICNILRNCSETVVQLRQGIVFISQLPEQGDHLRYVATSCGDSGVRGRPKLQVEKQQIEYLRDMNFTWSSISHLLV